MTHVAVRRPSMRGNQMTETIADMGVGDMGETLVAMNLRSEIDYKSDIVGSLQEGIQFTVVETGANHRALVSSGNVAGWISTKTDLDQALTKQVQKGAGSFPVYEALVQLNLREEMEFNSPVVMTVPEGTQFDLIEQGAQNRVKILVDGTIGWTTAKTDLDQPLIKEMTGQAVTKMAKNLDTLIVRAASQAQVTKVPSSKSGGRGQERGRGRSNSGVASAERRANKPGEAGEAKAPPKLSKLAWCCG